MKKILVPTDFSACATIAVQFAVESAKLLPAELVLIHAFEGDGNVYIDYMGVNKEYNRTVLDDLKNDLENLKKKIEEEDHVAVTTRILRGTVAGAVLQVTEEEKIDLVVMGTLGASGLKEKLWGSKTSSIIGKSKVPVIAVPHKYEWKKPEKFLLATNNFEVDLPQLDFLFELAGLYMAQVKVAVFTDEDDDKAETFLEHIRKTPGFEKKLREKYFEETLTSSHLYGTDFSETLQQHIAQNEVDILVMITYQRSTWDRIFNPSKTKRMSYHTRIPLMAIPAAGPK